MVLPSTGNNLPIKTRSKGPTFSGLSSTERLRLTYWDCQNLLCEFNRPMRVTSIGTGALMSFPHPKLLRKSIEVLHTSTGQTLQAGTLRRFFDPRKLTITRESET